MGRTKKLSISFSSLMYKLSSSMDSDELAAVETLIGKSLPFVGFFPSKGWRSGDTTGILYKISKSQKISKRCQNESLHQ